MKRFRQDEQTPPPPRQFSPGVVERLDGIIEVDPTLMEKAFNQQTMPVWDSERIVSSRTDYLNWMHAHFADETLYYGSESEATEDNPPH